MKSLIRNFLWVCLLGISLHLQATAQAPDYLILDGKKVALNTNPLERFFDLHPDRRPKGQVTSTGCWRGYVATFEIVDARLFVQKVEIEVRDPGAKPKEFKTIEKDVTNSVFQNSSERFCDWFTATLILPQGAVVNYVHMGYGSTFERYTLISIKAGIQTNIRSFAAREFNDYRKQQFDLFRKTKEYQAILAETLKEGGSKEDAERFLFEFLSESYLSQSFEPSHQ